MNELSWRILGVFYEVYRKTKDLFSTEADQRALETALGINAQDLHDAVGHLVEQGYLERESVKLWKLTREGLNAWEERLARTTPTPTRTIFVEASNLEELQAAVNQREAEGWEFVSIGVALAPPPTRADGSLSLVLADLGGPRLYVAALRRQSDKGA